MLPSPSVKPEISIDEIYSFGKLNNRASMAFFANSFSSLLSKSKYTVIFSQGIVE
jgi:hypothetical protein